MLSQAMDDQVEETLVSKSLIMKSKFNVLDPFFMEQVFSRIADARA